MFLYRLFAKSTDGGSNVPSDSVEVPPQLAELVSQNHPPRNQRRPNTKIHYPLFTPHQNPMPECPLKASAWEEHLKEYPDSGVANAAVGMIKYGARIGYEGPRSKVHIYKNHESAIRQPELLEKDLQDQISHHRLELLGNNRNRLPKFFVSCPLGLIDKSGGKKRRIHDLSAPAGTSVNDYINEDWGTVRYTSFEEALLVIASVGRDCVILKRDFQDAYRHIPVSPLDSRLLGFSWGGKFYCERFLPFGLRTAPYLFNFFAELFHWILERKLRPLNAKVVHYLDDFLIVLPSGSDWKAADSIYMDLTRQLGLNVKLAKNEQGAEVVYGGFVINTKKMEALVTREKQEKGMKLISKYLDQGSVSAADLKSLIGFLSFLASVIPLGRTFLWRLYDLQKEHVAQTGRQNVPRPIPDEAREDLVWWQDLLATIPSVQFIFSNRQFVEVFLDGTNPEGLGGFYRSREQRLADVTTSQAFAVHLPKDSQTPEDKNTRAMQTVEQCFLRWGQQLQHKRVTVHIDNLDVVRSLMKGTISGNAMDVLRRCLLQAAKYDVDIVACKNSRPEDSQLVKALSSFDRKRIKTMSPKLGPLLHRRSGASTP